MKLFRNRRSGSHCEKGQSLPLILIILVLGAVIAFAIAARTLTDLRRRSGEQRSAQAGTGAETLLDAITAGDIWGLLVSGSGWGATCQGSDNQETVNGQIICVLTRTDLEGLGLTKIPCGNAVESADRERSARVQIRRQTAVEALPIDKDKVAEFNVMGDNDFLLSWVGVAESNPALLPNLLLKFYSVDAGGGVTLTSSLAYRDSASAFENWGDAVDHANVPVQTGGASFVRIRPIGGDVQLTLQGLPSQELMVKAECYDDVGRIWREYVRRVPLRGFLPEAFDYVLFDGNSQIDEFDL